MDIKTAPRDGTEFLGCWDGVRMIVHFDGSFLDGEDWLPENELVWMPLPAPPNHTTE